MRQRSSNFPSPRHTGCCPPCPASLSSLLLQASSLLFLGGGGDVLLTPREPLLSWRQPWASGPGASGKGCSLPKLMGSHSLGGECGWYLCWPYLHTQVPYFSNLKPQQQHQAQGFRLPLGMIGTLRKSECQYVAIRLLTCIQHLLYPRPYILSLYIH